MTMSTSAAKLRGKPRPHTRLDRLAVVFADPIRLTIVSELFMREMGASEFAAAYGGGSASKIARHFKRLETYGWLRFVRERPSGGPGRPEKLYRSAQLAIFDEATWAQLPQSLKEEFSWRIFDQFAERVKEAQQAKTFDARQDRHFTWTPLVLDEQGRRTVFRIVDELFESLLEEQADARIRMHYADEPCFHVTASLGAFQSPAGARNLSRLVDAGTSRTRSPSDQRLFASRLAKVFNSEVNLKIVTELNLRVMSPSEFAAEFGFDDDRNIRSRFEQLEQLEWLEQVRQLTGGKRRGGTETFYRATRLAVYDSNSWSGLSPEARKANSWRIFNQLAERVYEAFTAKTFDAHCDRHLSWVHLILDQMGWERSLAATEQCFRDVQLEQGNAKVRMRSSGEEPNLATVHFAVFESPPPPSA